MTAQRGIVRQITDGGLFVEVPAYGGVYGPLQAIANNSDNTPYYVVGDRVVCVQIGHVKEDLIVVGHAASATDSLSESENIDWTGDPLPSPLPFALGQERYALSSHDHDTRYSRLGHFHDWGSIQNTPSEYPGIWQTATLIPSSSNLDDYDVPGHFVQNTSAYAAAGTNYPAALAGLLTVGTNPTAGQVYQTYHTYNNAGFFTRTRYNGTWYPWKRLGPVVQKGNLLIASVAMNGSLTPKVAISFDFAFTSKPTVQFECSNGRLIFTAQNVTTTGFELGADNWSTANSPGNLLVYWRAVEDI